MTRIVKEEYFDGSKEKIDKALRDVGDWTNSASGDVDWIKCRVIDGVRVCVGVEVQMSARSDLIFRDIVHFQKQMREGHIDVCVEILPSDVLSPYLTDRTPLFSDGARVIKEMRADDLPVVLIAVEHDGFSDVPLGKKVMLLVVGVCVSPVFSFSQTSSTALSGTIYDPSGAVVGGAAVTAVNEATGVTFKQTTNESGLYSFPSIGVGTYTVTVEIGGFKTARRTGITLNIATPAVQNITLELGETRDAVTVEAAAAPINTTSATLGNIVERTAVVTLPLNGRNPLNLIVLEPGVQQNSGTTVTVNGMRGQSGNVTIDGIEANEASNPTPVNNVFRINPDNVEEFKVTTSNPTPEEGKNAGLNVAIATRSGTNEYHLSMVHYFRNTVLNANEFYANAQGNPRTNIKSNQYGFDVAGPIKKNKTFFYGAWQGQRVNLALAIDKAFGNIPTVYTPQALSGIYRYFVADPANPLVITVRRDR